jgi:D-3-phosphoglycerate dehydrogenase / 2-oxoglutarate reductase
MVNKDFLSHMKPDAILLNTSRGTVVNEEHLLAHLEANKNFWFGTDVFNGEPAGTKEVSFTHPLAQHPRVYGSHHIGASTKQSEAAIGEEAVRIIKKYAT